MSSSHIVTIGGEEVRIGWDQQTARAYNYRASKIGGAPTIRDLSNAKRATAAVTDLLWLVLPPEAAAKYRNPEELFIAIDHDADAATIHAALVAIVADMKTDTEKKSDSKKSPSPELNSD
ncbi:hypothetical protein JIN84_12980 [Luteolibacter yonseiensis]|uniref:Uncharacterized protein n=1 Tax=Luteolibacter yonseiensis TaxID=1144680 RepID=A0A934VAT7_9BACT|nr:hypothetical protein [Luteolibacter yonseiensis]MBK1816533.1 hypothetical protein [Luteolibacter yonseiensis]